MERLKVGACPRDSSKPTVVGSNPAGGADCLPLLVPVRQSVVESVSQRLLADAAELVGELRARPPQDASVAQCRSGQVGQHGDVILRGGVVVAERLHLVMELLRPARALSGFGRRRQRQSVVGTVEELAIIGG